MHHIRDIVTQVITALDVRASPWSLSMYLHIWLATYVCNQVLAILLSTSNYSTEPQTFTCDWICKRDIIIHTFNFLTLGVCNNSANVRLSYSFNFIAGLAVLIFFIVQLNGICTNKITYSSSKLQNRSITYMLYYALFTKLVIFAKDFAHDAAAM